jgi:hypothetical protein
MEYFIGNSVLFLAKLVLFLAKAQRAQRNKAFYKKIFANFAGFARNFVSRKDA